MKIIRGLCAVVLAVIMLWVLGLGGYFFKHEVIDGNNVTVCISPSMEPLIMTNGFVVTDSSVPFEDIERGDIILFEAGIGRYVNHRVHQVGMVNDEKAVLTVGDNNQVLDDWVTTEDEYRGEIVANTNFFEPIISLVCGNILEGNTLRMVGGTGIAVLIVVGLVMVVFWNQIKKIRRKSI